MLEIIYRPLLRREATLVRAAVARLRRQMIKERKGIFIAAAIVTTVLWALTMLVCHDSWAIVTTFWVVVGSGIATWNLHADRRHRKTQIHALERAIERNTARVVRIQSTQMVEFAEFDDEGPGYALQVGEDSIVFIQGQQFYQVRRFPSTDFSLVEVLDDRWETVWQIVLKRGGPLIATHIISAEAKCKLRWPIHLEVIHGRLAQIEQLLASSD